MSGCPGVPASLGSESSENQFFLLLVIGMDGVIGLNASLCVLRLFRCRKAPEKGGARGGLGFSNYCKPFSGVG